MIRQRRFTALGLAVLTLSLALLGFGARSAFAADGDPYLDQCLTLAAAGSCTAGTGQAGAQALAVHPNQRWVYVGYAGTPARVDIYDRTAKGALVRRAGAGNCVSTNGSAGQCTTVARLGVMVDMAIDKNGQNLYVPGANGSLSVFTINQDNGSLTPGPCYGGTGCTAITGGGIAMAAVEVDPVDASTVYVRITNGLLAFNRAGGGALTQMILGAGCYGAATCTPAAGLGGTGHQLAIAADGEALYAPTTTGGVAVFLRLNGGALLQPGIGTAGACITAGGTGGCVTAAGGQAVALASAYSTIIDPQGSHVYVSGDGGMALYTRDRATARLTFVECYVNSATDASGCKGRLGSTARHAAWIAAGAELATATGTGRIGFLVRNASTGTLTQRPGRGCVTTGTVPAGCIGLTQLNGQADIAVSDNNLNVYTAQLTPGSVVTFQRDFAPVCAPGVVTVPGNTAVQVPFSCSDINGDTLAYDILRRPGAGQLAEPDQGAGVVFYNPFAAYAGPDSFDYRAVGRGIPSATTTASLNVVGGAPAPPRVVLPSGLDADGDGFMAGQDCNDGNRNIRPGATEIKGNNTDENCDGTAEPFPTLTSGVAHTWSWTKSGSFTLKKLEVTQQFPKGWTVQIKCSGSKCPFKSKKLKGAKVKKSASSVMASLTSKQRKFRAGQTVEVWVSAPEFNTKVARIALKKGKQPAIVPYCVLPGSTKVQKTCV